MSGPISPNDQRIINVLSDIDDKTWKAIFEVLNAPNFHTRVMDIDPVIGEEFIDIDNKCDGEKVSVQ